jgi:PIN domain
MQLREGRTAAEAIEALEQLVYGLENCRAYLNHPADVVRDRYLIWTESAERELRNLFSKPEAPPWLHSPRYAQVRELQSRSVRAAAFLGTEIDAQAAWLDNLIQQLCKLVALADRPGQIVVPDTNVLLHYQQFDQIDWCRLIGSEAVRLIILVQVVEELDEKKYAGRQDLRRRAGKILKALDKFLDQPTADPIEVRAGVTLEILSELPDGPGSQDYDQDGRILAACQTLQQATSGSVTLVTGDRAMRVRARAHGLAVYQIPDRLLKPLSSDVEAR